ncbi:hypothetical protein [Burkholderia glumae]|uniref:hypothetical protein n=1 Tax=Burkholderia glumae TaxID=337 RepID=UPI0012950221|nr:hypothetical protein [Burkholderia glumae]MCM2547605.1 hypothetical protein [Burkholderia glumae]NVE21759.1 hypothetical protein [Burkholderia glumae]QGA37994.1 hypothetical protein GAS19_10390 [Burkholderia glumae]UVS95629.1 hypothetical protein EFP19_07510 [Burkholderia glumae]
MKTHASGTRQESATSEVRLQHRQSLIVALPRGTRLVVAEGAAQLAFPDPTLDWLGTAVPTMRLMLHEGDTHQIERPCHVALSGIRSGMTTLHLEAPVKPGLMARVRAWFARNANQARTGAVSPKGH